MAAISAHELDLPMCDTIGTDRDDRFELIDSARKQHWLARTPVGLALMRYEDTVAVLRDRRFHSALSMIPQMQGVSGSFLEQRRPSILAMEGDEHARLRRLVDARLHSRRGRPAAAVHARDHRRAHRRGVPPAAATSSPRSASRIRSRSSANCSAHRRQDWQLFSPWATDIFRLFNQNLAEDLPAIERALADLETTCGHWSTGAGTTPGRICSACSLPQARSRRPAFDGRSDHARRGGADGRHRHDPQPAGLLCRAAGRTSGRMAKFVEHPELAPRVVEETMRYLGAVQGTMRVASEDIVYRDVLFPAGTLVSLLGRHEP